MYVHAAFMLYSMMHASKDMERVHTSILLCSVHCHVCIYTLPHKCTEYTETPMEPALATTTRREHAVCLLVVFKRSLSLSILTQRTHELFTQTNRAYINNIYQRERWRHVNLSLPQTLWNTRFCMLSNSAPNLFYFIRWVRKLSHKIVRKRIE